MPWTVTDVLTIARAKRRHRKALAGALPYAVAKRKSNSCAEPEAPGLKEWS